VASVNPARIGCSGWNYASWRGRLYPEGIPQRRWLELYARAFDTVEVNTTFYHLPRRESVANWVRQTPRDFTFAVKASRYLTHIKRFTDFSGIARFYEPLQPLIDSGKLGPVLWQLPANFRRDDDRLHNWLAALPAGQHTIEFRDPSWFVAPVLAALREHGVALTIGDHPDRLWQSHEPTASWRFVRFHWGARGRRGNYSATEIAAWAQRMAQWRQEGAVWAYFNNDWEGFAPRNARLLAQRLGVARRPQPVTARTTGTRKRASSSAGSTSSR
jgi:uncharacterized protein YecE (DUF72 family)